MIFGIHIDPDQIAAPHATCGGAKRPRVPRRRSPEPLEQTAPPQHDAGPYRAETTDVRAYAPDPCAADRKGPAPLACSQRGNPERSRTSPDAGAPHSGNVCCGRWRALLKPGSLRQINADLSPDRYRLMTRAARPASRSGDEARTPRHTGPRFMRALDRQSRVQL